MFRYESPVFASLVAQLRRSPLRLRLKLLGNAEFLLSLLQDDRSYPIDFVCHALTGYRLRESGEPRDADKKLIPARTLRTDLLTLAEDLSCDARLALPSWPERLFSVTDLAERFEVSTKTIFRWHRRGLVGWRFVTADRRSRLMFSERAIRRFVAQNSELVARGSSFSQLTGQERTQVVARAAELVEAGQRTVNAVARVIASETGRAVETIRLILKRHDELHPRAGIFNRSKLKVAADDKRLILWEAYVDGCSVQSLAERFDQPVAAVYRVITEMRARDLKARAIEYVDAPEFAAENADTAILDNPEAADPYVASPVRPPRLPADLPPYLRQLFSLPLLTPVGEAALFRKFNYLKWKAARVLAALAPEAATARELDQVERLLDQANQVKNQIIQANLRLVVSIAKRHLTPGRDFFELVSDGNISLMRAVEKFDFTRGFKFSTYASWAVMKNFARTVPEQRLHGERYQTGRDELLENAAGPGSDEPENNDLPLVRSTLDRMLAVLDERESSILRQRYGLDGGSEPQTLEQIGQRFGISKERIRQLEARALTKLRSDFANEASRLMA